MNKYIFSFLLLFGSVCLMATNRFTSYSSLPDIPLESDSLPLSELYGAFTGVNNNVLIVAGGIRYQTDSIHTGAKFFDDIFILKETTKNEYTWEKKKQRLPFASAYGGAISTTEGLYCFGGITTNNTISLGCFIRHIAETGEVEVTPAPDLPVSLSGFASAELDGYIYIAGGIGKEGQSEKYFYRMKVSDGNTNNWKWEELTSWPGKARFFPIGINQSNGLANCFYLFSGINTTHPNILEFLGDAYCFNPSQNKWEVIFDDSRNKLPVAGGPAFSIGAGSIILTLGNNHNQNENIISQTEKLIEEDQNINYGSARLYLELYGWMQKRTASTDSLISFNTITLETTGVDSLPGKSFGGERTIHYQGNYIVQGRNVCHNKLTSGVLKINVQNDNRHLSFIDIIVIALYFAILSWMGYFFAKRQKDTNDYFKGGGRIPWWAAGLSIFGTALSAITFMAIPAKTFATDWSYFTSNMTIFLVAPVIILLFIPFFRRLNVTTAYEFLETRFNLTIRLIGSLSFIIYQVGRMGVVLFLPSIALNVVTGIDIFLCITLMGVVALLYTMLGGIEAVIWTDVMQVIVLLGGAILSLILIILKIDGGFSTIIDIASGNHKFNVFDLTLSLKQPTVWVMLLGGIFANITTYGTDQTMVQRYLTTKTQKEANRSVWTNAILIIPSTLLFFFVGTSLFGFYKTFPGELNPTIQSNDAIFPWYIASELPAGVSGILIAGIFAAAMSSLSSSMNSAATAYSTDIHFRFGWSPNMNPLKLARIATFVVGISGTLFAFTMATMDIQSLWDEFQKVLGLVIGSLGGVFLLGILSKKANTKGVLVGIIISIITQILVAIYQPVHLIVYSATGVISCFFFGWIASWILVDRRWTFVGKVFHNN